MTSTPIYLIVQVSSELTAKPLCSFFSESKAHAHVAQLNIDQPEFTYTIQQIELKGH